MNTESNEIKTEIDLVDKDETLGHSFDSFPSIIFFSKFNNELAMLENYIDKSLTKNDTS